MKNSKKLIFCIFFAVFCLFTVAVFSSNTSSVLLPIASAAENGIWGENLTWTLDDEGVLTVSGTGEMASSTEAEPFPWEAHSDLIKKIVISDGVTSIAEDAFYRCETVTDLTVSKDVKIINSYAFSHCSSLVNVRIPENSSLINIAASSFAQCTSLEYIFIPVSVTRIGASAFSGSPLKTIDIPEDSKLETVNLSAFSATRLEIIPIPALVKSVVTSSVSVSSLKEINVAESNTKYTDTDGVLFDKTKETLVYYPPAKSGSEYTVPSGVRLIKDHAFYKNQSIVTLNIPNTVTSIEKNCCSYMFSLEYINFEEGIQLKNIPQYAFFQDTALKKITIPNSVTAIGNLAFSNCTNVQRIVFEENSSLETVSANAFASIKGFTEDIIIPDSVKTIGYGAFYSCSLNGNRIIISETSQLETIDSLAFSDVRLYENTFYIPPTVKTIGQSAFNWTSSSGTNKHIKTIYYGGSEQQWNEIAINEDNDEIFNADIIFDYNSSLYKNITVKKNSTVTEISGIGATPSSVNPSYRPWNEHRDDTTAIVISGEISVLGKNSFASFSELTYIIIRSPEIHIEDGAFNNCPLLETVIILGNSEFTENAFVGCAENMRIFERKNKQHTFTENTESIFVIPFSYSENSLLFEGTLSLDSYEFFDIISVFATEYENIEKIRLSDFSFEDIVLYRYDEENMSRVPIDSNKLTDGEIHPEAFIEGEIRAVSFNELCEGMADGSISDFYLITADKNNGKIEDTQVEVIDSFRDVILRAIRWVVTLMNRLFRMLKSFFG
ncbi:MAG: leucine-rich repeat protein [Clostridia bacterium]|nr:leucine-rich repeat protein [Clostridia bacterium]